MTLSGEGMTKFRVIELGGYLFFFHWDASLPLEYFENHPEQIKYYADMIVDENNKVIKNRYGPTP